MNPIRSVLAAVFLCVAVAPLRAETVTLVILPPMVRGADIPAETAAAIEMLCDRLATALGQRDGIRVVDRQHLAKVLAEHKLASRPPKPILSYDAMVRMIVDLEATTPKVRLRMVDLSRGNELLDKPFPWKERQDEERVAELASACAGAAKPLLAADARLKVRVVSPVVKDRRGRLEPLAERLRTAMEACLDRSPKACWVGHLEAADSVEESFLLLTGQSRLGGGRRFAPQADAVVEARIEEVDPLGKDFQETTIQVQVRASSDGPSQWKTVRGKVADWDSVTASCWQTLAKQLRQVDPSAARDYLRELGVRRAQARAEVEKLLNLGATGFPTHFRASHVHRERLELIAHTAATAAKLDPTNETAAFVNIKFNFILREEQVRQNPVMARRVMLPVVAEMTRYLRQFPDNADFRKEIAQLAMSVKHWVLHEKNPSPPNADAMWALADLVDLATDVPEGPRYSDLYHLCAHACEVYRAMLGAGIAGRTCREWRDKEFAKAEKLILEMRRDGRLSGDTFERIYGLNQAAMIESSSESGQADQVRRRLKLLMELVPRPKYTARYRRTKLLAATRTLEDPGLRAKVEAWLTPANEVEVKMFRVGWPAEAQFRKPTPPAPVRAPDLEAPPEWSAKRIRRTIGIGGGRMYVDSSAGHSVLYPVKHGLYNSRLRMAFVEVDAQGQPTSARLTALPDPQVPVRTTVSAARVISGKLSLATSRTGLLIYDPGTGKWTRYDRAGGIPYRSVSSFVHLEGSTALCAGGGSGKCAAYTVDLSSMKVVLRRTFPAQGYERFYGAWNRKDMWFTLQRSGFTANALSPGAALMSWPETPQGWPRSNIGSATSRGVRGYPAMAAVGDRLFISLQDGLREIDRGGRTLRVWPMGYIWMAHVPELKLYNTSADHHRIHVPAPVPEGTLIGADDVRLFFASGRGLACLDLDTDTWYGPLAVKALSGQFPTAFVGGDRVWLPTGEYVVKSEFLEAARKARHVATTAEFQDRLAGRIAAAKSVEQAKYAFSMHEFDRAAEILGKENTPGRDRGTELLLLGLLHDPLYRNRPSLASEYYTRAAQSSRKDVAATALYLQCQLHLRMKEVERAVKVGRSLLAQYDLYDEPRRNVEAVVTKYGAEGRTPDSPSRN